MERYGSELALADHIAKGEGERDTWDQPSANAIKELKPAAREMPHRTLNALLLELELARNSDEHAESRLLYTIDWLVCRSKEARRNIAPRVGELCEMMPEKIGDIVKRHSSVFPPLMCTRKKIAQTKWDATPGCRWDDRFGHLYPEFTKARNGLPEHPRWHSVEARAEAARERMDDYSNRLPVLESQVQEEESQIGLLISELRVANAATEADDGIDEEWEDVQHLEQLIASKQSSITEATHRIDESLLPEISRLMRMAGMYILSRFAFFFFFAFLALCRWGTHAERAGERGAYERLQSMKSRLEQLKERASNFQSGQENDGVEVRLEGIGGTKRRRRGSQRNESEGRRKKHLTENEEILRQIAGDDGCRNADANGNGSSAGNANGRDGQQQEERKESKKNKAKRQKTTKQKFLEILRSKS